MAVGYWSMKATDKEGFEVTIPFIYSGLRSGVKVTAGAKERHLASGAPADTPSRAVLRILYAGL